jgi:hypothetical protein
MKRILFLLAACMAAVLIAGCTLPTTPPEGTPAPTPTPTITPPGDMVPQPTSVVPPYYAVSVQVMKNTISTNPWISVTFEGGQGLGFATLMEATVIRSDGLIEMKSAQNPAIGTQLLLNGTTRTDRAIVNVTFVNGQTYTVKDELVPFQNINPTPAS